MGKKEIDMKELIKRFLHIHSWQYKSGGKFDTGKGWGLRYRECECGKKQMFDDFLFDYIRR